MQTLRIQIDGRVQGVWFRVEAKKQADILGICGWVRNNEDGSVEILAHGKEKQLKKLCQWCHEGPPLAQVDRVTIDAVEAEETLKSFEIR